MSKAKIIAIIFSVMLPLALVGAIIMAVQYPQKNIAPPKYNAIVLSGLSYGMNAELNEGKLYITATVKEPTQIDKYNWPTVYLIEPSKKQATKLKLGPLSEPLETDDKLFYKREVLYQGEGNFTMQATSPDGYALQKQTISRPFIIDWFGGSRDYKKIYIRKSTRFIAVTLSENTYNPSMVSWIYVEGHDE